MKWTTGARSSGLGKHGGGRWNATVRDRLTAWTQEGLPLLDLRPTDAFQERRFRGPVCHIPWRDLAKDAFLLPPRDKPFAILAPVPPRSAVGSDHDGDDGHALGSAAAAGALSFRDLASMEAVPPLETLVACFRGPRSPWSVAHVFADEAGLWEAAAALGLEDRRPVQAFSPTHLWSPTPVLAGHIATIESRLSAGSAEAFCCVDLGCGAGRDSAFLGLRGWRVVAVDNMAKALQRAESLAARLGVSDKLTSSLVDVKKDPDALVNLVRDRTAGGCDLLLVARFFVRPLLPTLRDIVRPGGCVLFTHFRDGVQSHEIGHPTSPDDIVQRGELPRAFDGWEVLSHDEETCLPDGRPMVTFLAQKPGPGARMGPRGGGPSTDQRLCRGRIRPIPDPPEDSEAEEPPWSTEQGVGRGVSGSGPATLLDPQAASREMENHDDLGGLASKGTNSPLSDGTEGKRRRRQVSPIKDQRQRAT